MANQRGKIDNSDRFYFLASKTTVNSDCSHEIKGHLFLGRKDVTNLDSVLKSRDITFPSKVYIIKPLLFNILSTLVITFLPRSKLLLFSWLQWWLQNHMQWFWSPPKIKSATISTLYPFICHEVMGLDAMMFVFWMLSFKTNFSLSSFTFIKRRSSSLSAIRVCHRCY